MIGMILHRIGGVHGKTPIRRFYALALVEHHVRRFEIAMNDAFVVGLLKRGAQLRHERLKHLPREQALGLLRFEIAHRDALDVFHRDERQLIREMMKIVDPNDVWMRQFKALPSLASHDFQRRRIVLDRRGETFESHSFVQHFVVGETDAPIPPCPRMLSISKRPAPKSLPGANCSCGDIAMEIKIPALFGETFGDLRLIQFSICECSCFNRRRGHSPLPDPFTYTPNRHDRPRCRR
ncbi:MAG: hypothetical protein ACI9OD_003453 [Limisphaerales bacterium]|jgi:hypothetical protein